MAKNAIIDKLNKFLSSRNSLSEENHVVYLMVEIRKILDHNREEIEKEKYKLLRFYCDWIVHTKKDKISKQIKEMMEDIYEEIINRESLIGNRSYEFKITKFYYFNELKEEIDFFFKENKLNLSLLKNKNWVEFIKTLVKVLSDQPIINPTENIEEFSFSMAAEGCVWGHVRYKVKEAEYETFEFGNCY